MNLVLYSGPMIEDLLFWPFRLPQEPTSVYCKDLFCPSNGESSFQREWGTPHAVSLSATHPKTDDVTTEVVESGELSRKESHLTLSFRAPRSPHELSGDTVSSATVHDLGVPTQVVTVWPPEWMGVTTRTQGLGLEERPTCPTPSQTSSRQAVVSGRVLKLGVSTHNPRVRVRKVFRRPGHTSIGVEGGSLVVRGTSSFLIVPFTSGDFPASGAETTFVYGWAKI